MSQMFVESRQPGEREHGNIKILITEGGGAQDPAISACLRVDTETMLTLSRGSASGSQTGRSCSPGHFGSSQLGE